MNNLLISERIPGLSTESLLFLRSVRGMRKVRDEKLSALAQKELIANGFIDKEGKFTKGLWSTNDDIILQEILDFRLEKQVREKQKEERMEK